MYIDVWHFIPTSVCNCNVFDMKIHTKTRFSFQSVIYFSGLSSRRAVTSSFQPPSRRARQATLWSGYSPSPSCRCWKLTKSTWWCWPRWQCWQLLALWRMLINLILSTEWLWPSWWCWISWLYWEISRKVGCKLFARKNKKTFLSHSKCHALIFNHNLNSSGGRYTNLFIFQLYAEHPVELKELN